MSVDAPRKSGFGRFFLFRDPRNGAGHGRAVRVDIDVDVNVN